MWLLEAQTLQLKEFQSEVSRPPYNILSHRWIDDQEVLFKEIEHPDLRERKSGIRKIQDFCRAALQEGIYYVWVDTCCINKESSAELSEAINSMYKWYAEAHSCSAYLFDVARGNRDNREHSLERSAWLTRGWTLQELIAPKKLGFYDRNWVYLGDRVSLSDRISRATKIDVAVLRGLKPPWTCSIATRMSWASGRMTTRSEDRAYSLLGLFGVNMALLYGEGGTRAFLRLQEEVIKYSDDHTIFAWDLSVADNASLLAPSPDCFAICTEAQTALNHYRSTPTHPIPTHSITNRGLAITLPLSPWSIDTYLALLPCEMPYPYVMADWEKTSRQQIGILLRRGFDHDQFARVATGAAPKRSWQASLVLLGSDFVVWGEQNRLVQVRQAGLSPTSIDHTPRVYGIRIAHELLRQVERRPKSSEFGRPEWQYKDWNESEGLLTVRSGYPFAGFPWMIKLDLSDHGKVIRTLNIGFDFDFNPVCFLAESEAINRLQEPLDPEISKPFRDRKPTDSKCWNPLRRTWRPSMVVQRNQDRMGLWQLKGDRLSGMSFALEGLGATDGSMDQSEDGGSGPMAQLSMQRTSYRDGLVWDFDLRGLRDHESYVRPIN